MRSLACLCLLASLMGGHMAACLAQQPSPARPPAGTVVRPRNGVQHPDLKTAWAEYDAVVAQKAEVIREANLRQFKVATGRGDFDAAVRLEESLERFEQHGELPEDRETSAAVASAQTSFARAKAALLQEYEDLKRALTRDGKINEARLVDGEMMQIAPAISPQRAQELANQVSVLAMTEEEWLRIPGEVFTVPANPAKTCNTGIVLQRGDRFLFLPCPTDRWNTSPGRNPDTDFRGHNTMGRTNNGMPFMRLCYSVAGGPLTYVLEEAEVNGLEGPLRFMPSDFAGDGDPNNNKGSVRVKVAPIR